MIWVIAVVLTMLWAAGFLTAFTTGGPIHILLVTAVVLAFLRILQGRQVL